jgi:hypothetical protein
MGFCKIDDLAHSFTIFDVGEEGGGGKVPSADYTLALYIPLVAVQSTATTYIRSRLLSSHCCPSLALCTRSTAASLLDSPRTVDCVTRAVCDSRDIQSRGRWKTAASSSWIARRHDDPGSTTSEVMQGEGKICAGRRIPCLLKIQGHFCICEVFNFLCVTQCVRNRLPFYPRSTEEYFCRDHYPDTDT